MWCGPEPAGDGERGEGGRGGGWRCSRGTSRGERARGGSCSVPAGPRQPPGRAARPAPLPLRPAVMDGLARNGPAANPQSAACWAQLDQQQASWYFWINTNKSSFSSWQVALPRAPQPPVSPALTLVRGEREERGDSGNGSQALGWTQKPLS